MPRIELETIIATPPGVCFKLVRDKRVQPAILKIEGPSGVGQMITFAAAGGRSLVVKVTEYQYPHRIVDTMIEGPFRSFVHEHEFREAAGGTLMLDTIEWTTPFGMIGRMADSMVLKKRLTRIVSSRNKRLKDLAEDDGS
jgi:ligand-binding SRPBCC domain-containing protein